MVDKSCAVLRSNGGFDSPRSYSIEQGATATYTSRPHCARMLVTLGRVQHVLREPPAARGVSCFCPLRFSQDARIMSPHLKLEGTMIGPEPVSLVWSIVVAAVGLALLWRGVRE